MRSLLFVPADNPRKLDKALGAGADALILDLEDSVAASAKQAARQEASSFLAAHVGKPGVPRLIVRINALDTGLADADLDAVIVREPWGVMLPKSQGGGDVQHLGAKLAVREAEHNLADGAIRIVPIATETATSVFNLGSYRGSSHRLAAMTWGAEDLAADTGSISNRDVQGAFTPPYLLVRNLMLFAAASAGVDAIDTICANFSDLELLQRECIEARRDGFTGKMAIHPNQVAVINEVFTPSPEDVAHARAIVEAFLAQPDAGVLSINGAMVDRPHLRNAERLLKRLEGVNS